VLDLPAIGEDQYGKSGSGYTQGRFRGQEMIDGEWNTENIYWHRRKILIFLVLLLLPMPLQQQTEMQISNYLNTSTQAREQD
jgi:hypothetical protein